MWYGTDFSNLFIYLFFIFLVVLLPNVIQLSIIQCGLYQLTCCVTLSEQKFHQTGFTGKWYNQSGIKQKSEKLKIFRMEWKIPYRIFGKKKSSMQIPTSNPSA